MQKMYMKILPTLVMFIFVVTVAAQDSSSYTTSEIIYGRKDGMALTFIKLTPKKNGKGKAILSLVSGNWISNFSMAGRYILKSIYLVNSGFTVFFIIHSSQPRYAINDEVEDIKRAVRFIRYNAKNYGVDAEHIGIAGSSSGGHLALVSALSDDKIKVNAIDPIDKNSSRIQAVAVFFPPTDFANWGGSKSNIDVVKLRKMVAGAFDFKTLSDSTGIYEHILNDENLKKLTFENSPVNLVSSDDPPVLIFHGDADPIVPLQQSQSLIKKLIDAGIKNELIIKAGGVHGWKNDEKEEKIIINWFDKYLR